MRVSFRVDNDFNRDIVRALLRRQPEIDFEAEQTHLLADSELLKIALLEDRLLVTHDISTIPSLFASLRGHMGLPGVILIPQSFPLRTAVETLELIWTLTEMAEWRSRIIYLPTLTDFIA